MQTFGEQMSSAGRAQVQAQLELFGNLVSAAIDNAGKLARLQLNATREVLDRSGAVWFEMLSAVPAGLTSSPAPAAPDQPGTQDAAPAALAVPVPAAAPDATRTPIAEAAAQVVPAAAAMHPVASPLPSGHEVELPRVMPLEASAPPVSASARLPRKKAPRK